MNQRQRRRSPLAGSYGDTVAQTFYSWELRGRGWAIFDHPVDPEPPLGRCRYALPSSLGFDDGRKVGILRPMVASVGKLLLGTKERTRTAIEVDTTEDSFPAFQSDRRSVLRVSVPGDCRVTKQTTERLLTSLGNPTAPISFEMVGHDRKVIYQLGLFADDVAHVEQTIRAFVPNATVHAAQDALAASWCGDAQGKAFVDFGLSEEFVLPIAVPASFDPHPLASAIAALTNIGARETGVFQILVRPVRGPWAAEMLRAIHGPSGDGLFEDAPQMVAQCREKVSRPLFAVVARIGAAAADEDRAIAIIRSIASTFRHLSSALGNELIALANNRYPDEAHERDLLTRKSRRTGMILNAQELACLAHVPDASVQIEGLDRDAHHTRPLPVHLRDRAGVLLGENVHRGVAVPVRLTTDDRTRHIHLLGGTGGGKSTLIANMVLQDLEAGHNLAVLDPQGDLVEEIAGRLPASRLQDVTYLDPSDPRGLVPVNMLAAESEAERIVLNADLASIFRRYVSTWGDQMSALLGSSVATVLDAIEGGTLLDLRRLLVDTQFRNEILMRVRDEEAIFYWQKVFLHVGTRAVAPLLARLDTFLRPRPVRAIVAGRSKGLDVPALLDGGVLLARLAQGMIGEDNARILGSLIATKINQAAFARQQIERADRKPFTLYVDEAHSLACSSMASILSGGRKYQVSIVLCHQDWDQWRNASDVANALLANAYTRLCFRLGDADAKRFAEGFHGFSAADFSTLRIGQAIARIGDASSSFSLNLPRLDPAKRDNLQQRREQTIAASSSRYLLRIDERPASSSIEVPPKPVSPIEPPVSLSTPSQAALARQERPKPTEASGKIIPSGGRGGHEHRYLQHFVKRLADERGLRTVLEEDIGSTRIDVALYCENLKIGCQIALNSSVANEATNAIACMAAGYSPVILIGTEDRHLKAIEHACEKRLTPHQLAAVRFVHANSIVEVLDALTPSDLQGIHCGYRVKVRRRNPGADSADGRLLVTKVIANSLSKARRNHKPEAKGE